MSTLALMHCQVAPVLPCACTIQDCFKPVSLGGQMPGRVGFRVRGQVSDNL
jgi:hypothetical protein